MASLRKRPKSDFWVCCYTTADGRRTQRSTGMADKEQAMMVCRQWEGEARMEREELEVAATGSSQGKGRRLIWAAAAIAVLLQIGALFWYLDREPAPVSLLVELDKSEAVPSTFMEQQFAKRHRWVRINEDALKAFDGKTSKFELNLFDDATHMVDVGLYRKHHNGANSILGRIEDDRYTTVVLSRRDALKDAIAGSIALADGRRFVITYAGDGKHVVVEMDMKIPPPHSSHSFTSQRQRGTPSGEGQPEKGKGKGVGANDYRYGKPQTQFALNNKDPKNPFPNSMVLATMLAQNATGRSFLGPGKTPPGARPNAPVTYSSGGGSSMVELFNLRGGPGVVIDPFTGKEIPGAGSIGAIEFIDVLFVYEGALLATSFGNDLDAMQLKVDNLVEETNVIFAEMLIPLEIRQATLDTDNIAPGGGDPVVAQNQLFLAEARTWYNPLEILIDANGTRPVNPNIATAWVDMDTPGQNAVIGAPMDQQQAAPAWREVSAGVKPVWQSGDLPLIRGWTAFPTLGVYQPLYEAPDFNRSTRDALDWVSDARNSLIYGDQFWVEPYINFPKEKMWYLLPVALDANATRNIPPYTDYWPDSPDYNVIDYSFAENPDIFTGPTDEGGWPFNVDYNSTFPIGQESTYGQTAADRVTAALTAGLGEPPYTTANNRLYVSREFGGSAIDGNDMPSTPPASRGQMVFTGHLTWDTFGGYTAIPPLNGVGESEWDQVTPHEYRLNNRDGDQVFSTTEDLVVGEIDPITDIFTPEDSTKLLAHLGPTALVQPPNPPFEKPLAVKWVDFTGKTLYARQVRVGNAQKPPGYTLHYSRKGAVRTGVYTDDRAVAGGGMAEDYNTTLVRSLTDGRNSQVWMTENFRHDSGVAGESFPNAANPQYGRFYTWTGAQNARPPGWRIPTDADWKNLETALGMSPADLDSEGRAVKRGELAGVGIKLKVGGHLRMNLHPAGYHTGAAPSVLDPAEAWLWVDGTSSGGNRYRRILVDDLKETGVYRDAQPEAGFASNLRLILMENALDNPPDSLTVDQWTTLVERATGTRSGFDINGTYNVLEKPGAFDTNASVAHGGLHKDPTLLQNGDVVESNSSTARYQTVGNPFPNEGVFGGIPRDQPYYIEIINKDRAHLRTTVGNPARATPTGNTMRVIPRSGVYGAGENGELSGHDLFNVSGSHTFQTGDQVFIVEGESGAMSFPNITYGPGRGVGATTQETGLRRRAQLRSPGIHRNTAYDVYRWNNKNLSLHGIRDRDQAPRKVYFGLYSGTKTDPHGDPTLPDPAVKNYLVLDNVKSGHLTDFIKLKPSTTIPLSLSIATHPLDVTTKIGAKVTFVVNVRGTGTITYQWRKDGTNIDLAAGAVTGVTEWDKAYLEIPNVQIAAHDGVYDVVVTDTDTGDTITAKPATLVVTPNSFGTLITSIPTGVGIDASPVIGSDGTVYFGTREGKVIAADKNGVQLWELQVVPSILGAPVGIYSSPVLNETAGVGRLYVCGDDNRVYAVTLAGTGVQGANVGTVAAPVNGWPHTLGGAVVTPGVRSSPAIDSVGTDAILYVGSDDGNVYALDISATNVTPLWNVDTGAAVRTSPAIKDKDTAASDGNAIVYVGSNNGKVWAIDYDKTTLSVGTFNVPGGAAAAVKSSPAIAADGTIYVGSDNGKVYALTNTILPDVSTNLQVWYPFSGNANDSTGNDRNGTAVGATLVPDRFGNPNSAYSYDGVNDETSQTAGANLPDSNSITISAWVNMPTAHTTTGNIFWDGDAAAGLDLTLCIEPLGAPGVVGSTQRVTFVTKDNLVLHADFTSEIGSGWHHVVCVADEPNNTRTIYIDGAVRGTPDTAWTGTANPSNHSPVLVGKAENGLGFFKGSLDEVRAYSRALSAVEVGTLANINTLTQKWEYTTGGPVQSSPVIDVFGNVYVGSDDDKLHAITSAGVAKTGWAIPDLGGDVKSTPAILDGIIVVGSDNAPDGQLQAFDDTTGAPIWPAPYTFAAGAKPGFSSPVIGDNGNAYIGTDGGRFYVVAAANTQTAIPWPRFRHNNLNTARSPDTAKEILRPVIVTNPQTVFTDDNSQVIFAVNAYAKASLTYQWQFYNDTAAIWDDILTGGDKTYYQLTSKKADPNHNMGILYRCQVKDGTLPDSNTTNASIEEYEELTDKLVAQAAVQKRFTFSIAENRIWIADSNATKGFRVRIVDNIGKDTQSEAYVVGGGTSSPDASSGIDANETAFTHIADIAVDAGDEGGSVAPRLYIAGQKNKVYRVEAGKLKLFAGGGVASMDDDNTTFQDSLGVKLNEVVAIATPYDSYMATGNPAFTTRPLLYIVDRSSTDPTAANPVWKYRIHRVHDDGNATNGVYDINTLSGGGTQSYLSAPGNAFLCEIPRIDDIAVDTLGRVYFGDNNRGVVMRLNYPTGKTPIAPAVQGPSMTLIVGSGMVADPEMKDGDVPLLSAGRVAVETLAIDHNGTLVDGSPDPNIANQPVIYMGGSLNGAEYRVRRLSPVDGNATSLIVATLAGGGPQTPYNVTGATFGTAVSTDKVMNLALDWNENVYFTDNNSTHEISWKVHPKNHVEPRDNGEMQWYDGQVVYIVDYSDGSDTLTPDPGGPLPDFVDTRGTAQTYPIKKIGNQIWMTENFRYDGSGIANPGDPKYGRLYNWAEIQDPSFAPPGWHVATDIEWRILERELGMLYTDAINGGQTTDQSTERGVAQTVGTQLKLGGTSGMDFLPAGSASAGALSGDQGDKTYLWVNSLIGTNPFRRKLVANPAAGEDAASVYRFTNPAGTYAISVRLIKDGSDGHALDENIGGDTYKTIHMGGRQWMAENLRWSPAGWPGTGQAGIYNVDDNSANSDEAGEYGKLYQFIGREAAVDVIKDWEVASDVDWYNLERAVAKPDILTQSQLAIGDGPGEGMDTTRLDPYGARLKLTGGNTVALGGSSTSGLDFPLAGFRTTRYMNFSTEALIWVREDIGTAGEYGRRRMYNDNDHIRRYGLASNTAMTLRLVKKRDSGLSAQTRLTAWPGLPPYEGATLPVSVDELSPNTAGEKRWGPFWVNVDHDITSNPTGNRFWLSSEPMDVKISPNGQWTNVGSIEGLGNNFPGSNAQSFDELAKFLFWDDKGQRGEVGSFYLVEGTTVDVDASFTGITCDLVRTERVKFEKNATDLTLYVDPIISPDYGTDSQVDFTFAGSIPFPVYFSGPESLLLEPGDFDPAYDGVAGVRGTTAGMLRMGINGGFDTFHEGVYGEDTGAKYFGPLAKVTERHRMMHGDGTEYNGEFPFNNKKYDMPTNPLLNNEPMVSNDPRADVVCLLIQSDVNATGGGIAYAYSKNDRGDANATPNLLEQQSRKGGNLSVTHPNVLRNRDSICFIACAWNGALPYYTFAHEMGHIMGAHHAPGDVDGVALDPLDPFPGQQPNITFTPFANNRITAPTDPNPLLPQPPELVRDDFISLGNYFNLPGTTTRFCTIMAYGQNGIPRINRYTSPQPTVGYMGATTGYSTLLRPPLYEPVEHDNKRTLETVGPVVTHYRLSKGTGRKPPEQYEIGPIDAPRQTRPAGADRPYFAKTPPGARNNESTQTANGTTAKSGEPSGSGGSSGTGTPPGSQVAAAPGVGQQGNNPGIGVGGGGQPPGGLPPGGGLPTIPTTPKPPITTTPRLRNDDFKSVILSDRNFAREAVFPARQFGVLESTNRGATGEKSEYINESAFPLYGGRSVWFRWNAPISGSGSVTFSTKGSDFDTTMKVFQFGKVNKGIKGYNDNAPDGAWSEVKMSFGGPADPRFYIIGVDGVSGVQGRIRISAKTE